MNPELETVGNCAATGVGSLPLTEIDDAVRVVLDGCPRIPYLPQLPRRSFLEDMCQQVAEGLPAIVVDIENKRTWVDTVADCNEDVTRFVEAYESGDVDAFAMSRERASGYFGMIEHLEKTLTEPLPVLKAQVVGPITFGLTVCDENGVGAVHNPVFGELVTQLVAMKARWLAKQMRQVARRRVIFYDEPSLSALGSAYFALERDRVGTLLDAVIDPLRDDNVTVGVHCCGNTDWPVLLERADVVSFDAFSYFDRMAVYGDELDSFYGRDGILAWGIVPTVELTDDVTAEGLADQLDASMHTIASGGIPLEIVRSHAVVTPACGMGTMSEADARRVTELTASVARIIRARYFS